MFLIPETTNYNTEVLLAAKRSERTSEILKVTHAEQPRTMLVVIIPNPLMCNEELSQTLSVQEALQDVTEHEPLHQHPL